MPIKDDVTNHTGLKWNELFNAYHSYNAISNSPYICGLTWFFSGPEELEQSFELMFDSVHAHVCLGHIGEASINALTQGGCFIYRTTLLLNTMPTTDDKTNHTGLKWNEFFIMPTLHIIRCGWCCFLQPVECRENCRIYRKARANNKSTQAFAQYCI